MILSIKQFVFLVLTLCVITLSSVRAQETGAVIGRNLKKTKSTKNGKAPKNGKNDKTTNKPNKPKKTKAPKNNKKSKKTNAPTNKPTTNKPTSNPTATPTNKPTLNPTQAPTNKPTNNPTFSPTNKPTEAPVPTAFVTLPIDFFYVGDATGIVPQSISDDILLGAANAFEKALIVTTRRRLEEVGDDIVRTFEDSCLELTTRLVSAGCEILFPTKCLVLTESDARLLTTGACAAITPAEILQIKDDALETATEIGEGIEEIDFVLPTITLAISVAVQEITIPSESPTSSPTESAYPSPAGN